MTSRPAAAAQFAALHQAALSPCAKSRRGVAAFNMHDRDNGTGLADAAGYVHSSAHNRDPLGCLRTQACRDTCGKRCIHAEAAAMLALPTTAEHVDLVHVKWREGSLRTALDSGIATDPEDLDALVEPSGPPSCMQCAVLIAADPRVEAIWLLHRDDVTPALFVCRPGWHRAEVGKIEGVHVRGGAKDEGAARLYPVGWHGPIEGRRLLAERVAARKRELPYAGLE